MNNPNKSSCNCSGPDWPSIPHHLPKHEKSLAMAYVPWQKWQNVMDGCSALKHGTIFEDLVLPFEGAKAACASFGNKPMNYQDNYCRRGMR